MIGNIKVVGNIRYCIEYGLNDKRELSEEKKIDLSLLDGLQHKDRAEILVNHKCAGDAHKLTGQFSEVAKLSKRIEKPLFHASLRLAPGDHLTPEQWIEVATAWAEEFKVQDNQYLVILHKDSLPPHIHIVANRVGFDGKVASDSKDYQRMANFCRQMESRFNLTAVLNPRPFLRKDQRAIPRHDLRKLNLKNDIHQILGHATTFDEFKGQMEDKGYEVIKGRGITFVDEKKVRVKGSDLGYPLAKIEKMLGLNQQLAIKKKELTEYENRVAARMAAYEILPPALQVRLEVGQGHRQMRLRIFDLKRQVAAFEKAAFEYRSILFRVEYQQPGINPELLKEAKRKRKKKRLR